MILSELVKILQDTTDKDGDCDVCAGQIRTADGTTILTVAIPHRRVLRDQSQEV
jgi:hypothetical protein